MINFKASKTQDNSTIKDFKDYNLMLDDGYSSVLKWNFEPLPDTNQWVNLISREESFHTKMMDLHIEGIEDYNLSLDKADIRLPIEYFDNIKL